MYKVMTIKTVCEDDYQEGCSMESNEQSWTMDFKTLDDALDYVKSFSKDPRIFEDRIEHCVCENKDCIEPSEEEKELWRAGKKVLYCADYSCYIDEITSRSIDSKELKKLTGLKES